MGILKILSHLASALPRYCLGRREVVCGNSFDLILSILMCIRLSKYPIWLATYGDFHIFDIFALVKEKWHLTSILTRLRGIYQYAKSYQNNPNSLSAMAFSLTEDSDQNDLSLRWAHLQSCRKFCAPAHLN